MNSIRLAWFKVHYPAEFQKAFEYLSKYIKSKDEHIDWLLNAFLKFKREAESEDINRLFGGWYISLESEDEDKNNK